MAENKDIKVCIGLSGGVDSSVAAYLLKQQGYDVFALFMQNWHDASTTLHGDCEWEEDRFVAELVARKVGIPFYFVDLSKEYRQRVVDYMFDEYEKGRTPNPDVLCNREIKFDAFLKCAKKLGADFVATGHYCRKEEAIDADGNVNGLAVGTANIKITVKTQRGGTYTVTKAVKIHTPVDGVTIINNDQNLNVGEKVTVSALVGPSDAGNQNIIWSSDNNDVVSVDENGVVTAISEGTATITVTTEEGGENNGVLE